MELFIVIRHMISDSRQIALNYDLKTYEVTQVKERLFLFKDEQPKEICDRWFRLYHGEGTKEDIKWLNKEIEKC